MRERERERERERGGEEEKEEKERGRGRERRERVCEREKLVVETKEELEIFTQKTQTGVAGVALFS